MGLVDFMLGLVERSGQVDGSIRGLPGDGFAAHRPRGDRPIPLSSLP